MLTLETVDDDIFLVGYPLFHEEGEDPLSLVTGELDDFGVLIIAAVAVVGEEAAAAREEFAHASLHLLQGEARRDSLDGGYALPAVSLLNAEVNLEGGLGGRVVVEV